MTNNFKNNFKKLVNLDDATKGGQESGDISQTNIIPGIQVEHQRFGKGKVLKVEGSFPNLTATVFFHNSGQKQLLLKFAKLKIAD